MENSKKTLQDLGFTRNHAFVVGVSVLLFVVLVMPRFGVKLSAMFSEAEQPQGELLTYEQVRSEVYADSGLDSDSQDYINNLETQFALLDRGQANGQVLGEAIGLDQIPSADQLYSDEQLSLIPIKETVPTSTESVQTYSDRVLRVESYYNTPELFSNLNSSDPNQLAKTQEQVQGIIDSFMQLPVPSELVDYHRFSILYYQTLSKLGQTFINDDGNMSQYSSAMFSLTDRLSSIKIQVQEKYKVAL